MEVYVVMDERELLADLLQFEEESTEYCQIDKSNEESVVITEEKIDKEIVTEDL